MEGEVVAWINEDVVTTIKFNCIRLSFTLYKCYY